MTAQPGSITPSNGRGTSASSSKTLFTLATLTIASSLPHSITANSNLEITSFDNCPTESNNYNRANDCCAHRFGVGWNLPVISSYAQLTSLASVLSQQQAPSSILVGGQLKISPSLNCSWIDSTHGCNDLDISEIAPELLGLNTLCLAMNLTEYGETKSPKLFPVNCKTYNRYFACQKHASFRDIDRDLTSEILRHQRQVSSSAPASAPASSTTMMPSPVPSTSSATRNNTNTYASQPGSNQPWRPAWVIAMLVVLFVACIGTIAFVTRRAYNARKRRNHNGNVISNAGFEAIESPAIIEDSTGPIPLSWGASAFVKGLTGSSTTSSSKRKHHDSLEVTSPPKPESIKKVKGFSQKDIGKLVNVEGYAQPGYMRYVGLHKIKKTPRVGVQFNEPIGKNNGTVGEHHYFNCPPNCGVLVKPRKVKCMRKPSVSPSFENTNSAFGSNDSLDSGGSRTTHLPFVPSMVDVPIIDGQSQTKLLCPSMVDVPIIDGQSQTGKLVTIPNLPAHINTTSVTNQTQPQNQNSAANQRRIDAWLVDGITSDQADHSLLDFPGLSPGCYCFYTTTSHTVMVVLMSETTVAPFRILKDLNGDFCLWDKSTKTSKLFKNIYDLAAYYSQERISSATPLLNQCIPIWMPDKTSSA